MAKKKEEAEVITEAKKEAAKNPEYVVAAKRAVTCLNGVIGAGTEAKASLWKDGENVLKNLIKKGVVVPFADYKAK